MTEGPADDDTVDRVGPMKGTRMRLGTTCPMCHQPGLEMRNYPLDIPYFHEALQITVLCGSCSFRYSDMQLFSQNEPVRYVLRGNDAAHLSIRIVRSASGTIRVPELGMDVEPGMASDAFVSNVEGVLDRFKGALEVALAGLRATPADTDDHREKVARAEELLCLVEAMMKGEEEYTIVLEDPLGNSAILDKRAEKETLSVEEAKRLKTGYYEVELGEIKTK